MPTTTLASTWDIPTYARSHLNILTDTQHQADIIGEGGAFTLDNIPDTITICWGDAPLTQLNWQAGSLDWTGDVRLGGFVTAIHMTQLQAIDYPLAIITLEAYPLKPDVVPYLSATYRDRNPYPASELLDGIDDSGNEGVTTWIADVDSPLVNVMQDAMNQAHRVYVFGQLCSEEQGWHHLFALPILLESVTTFMQ